MMEKEGSYGEVEEEGSYVGGRKKREVMWGGGGEKDVSENLGVNNQCIVLILSKTKHRIWYHVIGL